MQLDISAPAGFNGYVQAIAATLDFGADRLKAAIAGLTPEQLARVPEGFANSIATLVVHIYGIEAGFAHRMAGAAMADDLKAEFLLDKPQSPLPAAAGETVESLTAKIEKGRSILVERLASLTEEDLTREVPLGPEKKATVRWMIALLANHQAIHLGQIQMIKKLVG